MPLVGKKGHVLMTVFEQHRIIKMYLMYIIQYDT
jgi:hypothetical protein